VVVVKAAAAAGEEGGEGEEEEEEEEEEEDSVDGYEIDWVGATATDIEQMHATLFLLSPFYLGSTHHNHLTNPTISF
jgi:hypothetical protein